MILSAKNYAWQLMTRKILEDKFEVEEIFTVEKSLILGKIQFRIAIQNDLGKQDVEIKSINILYPITI